MTPSQYHQVLLALDRVLVVFKDAESDVTSDDLKLILEVSKLRAKVLRAESGHPFPLLDRDEGELDPETTKPPFVT